MRASWITGPNGKLIKRVAKIVVIALLAVSAVWGWRRWSGPGKWGARPFVDLGILVVDYTVPFDNYREHAGLFWLLNHRKIRAPVAPPPGAAAGYGEAWQLARDYVGYRPDDREHPVRLAHVNRSGAQLIYVADTYGVYKDDLRHIDSQTAHMDYTALVFGGLSDGDAYALSDFVGRGGLLVAEFNAFCEPTGIEQRKHMQDVFGVDWTEWVGRVFADPYDPGDVPHWLPREFARQYPGKELPHSPILLLVARDGHLIVLAGPSLIDVAPRVVMTGAGRKRYPSAPGDAPYYFWFSLVRARPDTIVHARLQLPKIEGVPEFLATIAAGAEPPALTERVAGPGRAIYFVGDFADIDFDPGEYDNENSISNGAELVSSLSGMTTGPAFWRFYAPVMDQLLREAVAARARVASSSMRASEKN
jgi:hypothetical protein